jgi:hypothetical protein
MRAAGLGDDERALFCSLLDSVESAWPHVRTLQHLHDQLGPSASGALVHVLDFIDTHVCDLFVNFASGVEAFIPEPSGAVVRVPDFDATNADAEQFVSFLVVLRSASCDAALPQPAASAIRSATEALRDCKTINALFWERASVLFRPWLPLSMYCGPSTRAWPRL